MAQDNSISTDAPMQQPASDEDMREDMRLGMSLNDIHMSISRAFHTMNNTTRPCARSLGLGQGQPRILSYIAVHGVSTQPRPPASTPSIPRLCRACSIRWSARAF